MENLYIYNTKNYPFRGTNGGMSERGLAILRMVAGDRWYSFLANSGTPGLGIPTIAFQYEDERDSFEISWANNIAK